MTDQRKEPEMTERDEIERTVGAFVTVFAHSTHWRGLYVPQAAESAQWAADHVACTALEIEPGTLLAAAAQQSRPPYLTKPRELWIEAATGELSIKALTPEWVA